MKKKKKRKSLRILEVLSDMEQNNESIDSAEINRLVHVEDFSLLINNRMNTIDLI